jgi:hypothetical protein
MGLSLVADLWRSNEAHVSLCSAISFLQDWYDIGIPKVKLRTSVSLERDKDTYVRAISLTYFRSSPGTINRSGYCTPSHLADDRLLDPGSGPG